MDNAEMIGADRPGAVRLGGSVLDVDGPVPDALIELWRPPLFARALTEADGSYRFTVSKPAAGDDGSAPHLEMSVLARGLLQRLVTRIYFPDEVEANSSDPVLALVPEPRRHTLVARSDAGGLQFDLRLRGEDETVFFAY
jgi:protocatechuate 3,4-dioxygenase alpha subunit